MKIVKEIFIVLLLCIAILLVLGILFYDDNPMNKVIPNKIAYTVPENIKEELKEEVNETKTSIENIVYTIDDVDLNAYKKSKTYDASKENPFASSSTNTTNTTSTSGVISGGSTSTSSTSSTSKSSSGTSTSTSNVSDSSSSSSTTTKGLK